MKSLFECLQDESILSAAVADCCALLDAEVAKKGGLSGIAIKTGYKTVKGIRPGFLEKVFRDLLPEFAEVLDPLRAEAAERGVEPVAYLREHSSRVADALLAITDQKAERSTNRVVKSAYGKLRGLAKSNV